MLQLLLNRVNTAAPTHIQHISLPYCSPEMINLYCSHHVTSRSLMSDNEVGLFTLVQISHLPYYYYSQTGSVPSEIQIPK